MKLGQMLVGASVCALAVAGFAATASAQAQAQATPAPSAPSTSETDDPALLDSEVEAESGQAVETANNDAIVITGSRIRRPNLESTVPIRSVGPQELTERGNLSLGDALNELPALRATWSQSNSTRAIGTAGLNQLDLRGLGIARTLVLVNNRRHVTSQPGGYTVDVNTIPTDLLERVDVVTGGNSAVYGSDAIAGVVNFITRRDFEGIRLRGQGGISTYGDRGNHFVSLTAGKNLFDDRLNVAGAIEYVTADALYFKDRARMTGAFTGNPTFMVTEPTGSYNPLTRVITPTPNRNDNGIPNTGFFDPGPTRQDRSNGGSIQPGCPYLTNAQYDALSAAALARHIARLQATCVALGTDAQGRVVPTLFTPNGGALDLAWMFMPDGSLIRNVLTGDARTTGGGIFGGYGITGVEESMLIPGMERIAANIFFNGDISPAFQPFLEVKYVRADAEQSSLQPTFATGGLRNTHRLDNPFLTAQARQTIITILGLDPNSAAVLNGSQTFASNRWNYDLGTRQEDHRRETYRIVGGSKGDLSATGNLRYEVALNWGRTDTYYETGGNVHIARYDAATNTRLVNGQIVCFINTTLDVFPAGHPQAGQVNTTNDDPSCVPLNPFGHMARSEAAAEYVMHTSSREQWAEQLNAVAFLSGDTTGFFELPGGPVGFALGVEYRREDAYSKYDDVTAAGETFLNAFGEFDPKAQTIKEAFGELRLPIIRDKPFMHELTLEGAARVSDYNTFPKAVWAWNAGAVWAPVRDLRLRAGYASAVRAPDIGDLFAAPAQTFLNGAIDPCSQNVILNNPNRTANCAAAGVPTTMVVNGQTVPWQNITVGGISGINGGNLNLQPERSKSFSLGAVFQPTFLPGFVMSFDYYDVKVTSVIAALTAQGLVDACYDDPTGINNQYCAAVFRRGATADPLEAFTFRGQPNRNLATFGGAANYQLSGGNTDGPGFLQAPFNFAKLTARGIDLDMAYRRRLGSWADLNVRAIVTRNLERENFTFQNDPARSTRIHGTLGDPLWAANLQTGLDFGIFDVRHTLRYFSKMTVGDWEDQNSHQGRAPSNPDRFNPAFYPETFYHALRFGIEPSKRFRFYAGVDNVFNTLPPLGLDGTGTGALGGGGGAGGAIYPNTGRFFYAGAEAKF